MNIVAADKNEKATTGGGKFSGIAGDHNQI